MPRTKPSTPPRAVAQRFSVRLQPSKGLASAQEEAFDRQLSDYLAGRGMSAEGTQLQMTIESVDRELGVQDQADLACWIMDQHVIAAIHLKVFGATSASTTSRWVTATRSDRALEPLMQLYRMGRIEPDRFFDVLFSIRPDPLEIEAND